MSAGSINVRPPPDKMLVDIAEYALDYNDAFLAAEACHPSDNLAGILPTADYLSRQRSPAAPDIPTLAESGVPGYEVVSWYGVLGPAGMPPAIVKQLNEAITTVMTTDAMRARLSAEDVDIMSASPAQFAEYVRTELAKWGSIIRRAGIRADKDKEFP